MAIDADSPPAKLQPAVWLDLGTAVSSDELEGVWKETVVFKLRYYLSVCLDRPRRTTKYFNQDSRNPSLDWNLAPSERVYSVTTALTCSVGNVGWGIMKIKQDWESAALGMDVWRPDETK